MTAFSTQTLDAAAGALTFTQVTASDTCDTPANAGSMFLVFKGGTASDTITITPTQTTQYGRPLPAAGTAGTYTLALGATNTIFIPLYPEYGNPATGAITILNSAPATVTMAVVRY